MTECEMSPTELQDAYKFALRASLTAFYGKRESEADQLIAQWWKRATSESDDVRSGMYLHTEALVAAADLARANEVELTEKVRQRYRQILEESTRQALNLHRTLGATQVGTVAPKRTAKKLAVATNVLKHVAG